LIDQGWAVFQASRVDPRHIGSGRELRSEIARIVLDSDGRADSLQITVGKKIDGIRREPRANRRKSRSTGARPQDNHLSRHAANVALPCWGVNNVKFVALPLTKLTLACHPVYSAPVADSGLPNPFRRPIMLLLSLTPRLHAR